MLVACGALFFRLRFFVVCVVCFCLLLIVGAPVVVLISSLILCYSNRNAGKSAGMALEVIAGWVRLRL